MGGTLLGALVAIILLTTALLGVALLGITLLATLLSVILLATSLLGVTGLAALLGLTLLGANLLGRQLANHAKDTVENVRERSGEVLNEGKRPARLALELVDNSLKDIDNGPEDVNHALEHRGKALLKLSNALPNSLVGTTSKCVSNLLTDCASR